MAGLEIKNETVYVIYRNGIPYKAAGRKLVYTTAGAANSVITNVVKDEVNYTKEYYNLPRDERNAIVEKIKNEEFTVIEYGPKGGAK